MRILTLAIMAALTTLAATSQTQPVGGVNRADMDLTMSPGVDFYRYAGGGWMDNNPLKPEFSSYGVFDELAEKNREQLRDLFTDLAKRSHEKGTVGQKVTDLYQLAMDSVRLNKEGAQPLRADLDKMATFTKKNLTAFLADVHFNHANPFFGIGVDADLKNSDLNVMWLSAGTSGMPDRDYYLNTDDESRKTQQAYRQMLADLFMKCGYTKAAAKTAAKTIYDIEYRFAEAKLSRAEARDLTRLYNIFTISELQQRFPAINWKQYFTLMGTPDVDRVILTEPKVMDVAQQLMTTLTDRQIRDYLAGEIITGATGYLSDEIGETAFDFYGRRLSGQQQRKARWKRALGVPNGLLGEAVGELYVDKYFSKDSKRRMLTLVGNLRKALAEHIARLDWMDDSTKVNALVKLNSFTVKIGYPDRWRDYSGLTVDPALTLYDNIKAASVYETRRNLNKWGKPVDKDEWGMTPQTVNAYYNPTTNEICFPAAILQAPFFDANADDASNYGAIGVVIGHEMTHGFDDQGRMFDKDGNMTDWWTAADAERFNNAAQRLARQFDEVVVVGDLHANGQLTLGENIADQGGLRVAFDALQQTAQFKQQIAIDGFTPAQRFYLSYGRIWAENETDEFLYQITKSDPHSIGRNRVNVTLRNIDTFFNAFDIDANAPMWRNEDDRVIIW